MSVLLFIFNIYIDFAYLSSPSGLCLACSPQRSRAVCVFPLRLQGVSAGPPSPQSVCRLGRERRLFFPFRTGNTSVHKTCVNALVCVACAWPAAPVSKLVH